MSKMTVKGIEINVMSLDDEDVNYGEFALIRNQSGLNTSGISGKVWVTKTKSIVLQATAGNYGGTYAHKDKLDTKSIFLNPRGQY